ncbi:MAG: helix-turn-helix transcriptional regulator [Chloroflexi bacterium]|nr:helix-turn-helix transcriptional regulator [Chloroflexota bacterium]
MKDSQEKRFARQTAALLRVLGQPARLRILLAIGEGEACVCHLESALGMRQAYISQHLMTLRDADLVTSRRAGKYIFYRLRDTGLLDLICLAAQAACAAFPAPTGAGTYGGCACPHCSPQELITPVILEEPHA